MGWFLDFHQESPSQPCLAVWCILHEQEHQRAVPESDEPRYSGAQSAKMMRLSRFRRPEASKHALYEARHSRTYNALRHRSAAASDIEVGVGVGVGVAPRWCVAQSGAKGGFDLLLPAHGHPHNSGAVTAAKQRKRGTNRHDSVFFRVVASARSTSPKGRSRRKKEKS